MKWFDVHVGGVSWAVHLAKPGSKDLPASYGGICYLDRAAIYIDQGLSHPLRVEALLHELLHAAFYVSGAAHALTLPPTVDREEAIVRDLTPVIHRLLVDFARAPLKGILP